MPLVFIFAHFCQCKILAEDPWEKNYILNPFALLTLLGICMPFLVNVFHNKTCIRSAMESVIEIAGGAPRGLGRSLLGGDLALGIGSIPLVETVKPILINIWSSPVLPVCMADFGS